MSPNPTPPDPPRPDCYCGAVCGLAGRCEKCEITLCDLCARTCAICQAAHCAKHLTTTCTVEEGVIRACHFCADLAYRAERTAALRRAESIISELATSPLETTFYFHYERILAYLKAERFTASGKTFARFVEDEKT